MPMTGRVLEIVLTKQVPFSRTDDNNNDAGGEKRIVNNSNAFAETSPPLYVYMFRSGIQLRQMYPGHLYRCQEKFLS